MGCSCTKHIKDEELVNSYHINNDENNINNEKDINKNDIEDIYNTNIKIKNKNMKNIELNNNNSKTLDTTNNIVPKTQIDPEPKQQNINNNKFPYKIITTDKIPTEELDKLLSEYTPLTDDIIVELKSPCLCDNEVIYYGEWDIENNYRHGRGIQVWPNGEKYIGYWKNNHPYGKGKLFHINGDIYEGDFEMENIFQIMEKNIKVNGKMENRKEKEKKFGRMDLNMLDNIKKGKNQDMGF